MKFMTQPSNSADDVGGTENKQISKAHWHLAFRDGKRHEQSSVAVASSYTSFTGQRHGRQQFGKKYTGPQFNHDSLQDNEQEQDGRYGGRGTTTAKNVAKQEEEAHDGFAPKAIERADDTRSLLAMKHKTSLSGHGSGSKRRKGSPIVNTEPKRRQKRNERQGR